MHEASLMNDLMHKIAGIAAREGVSQITKVDVWLGALSHMSPAHFREHFEDAARGSLAEGARLVIECSDDIHHPDAQTIVLRHIEAED